MTKLDILVWESRSSGFLSSSWPHKTEKDLSCKAKGQLKRWFESEYIGRKVDI
jgi:hypothetical protein